MESQVAAMPTEISGEKDNPGFNTPQSLGKKSVKNTKKGSFDPKGAKQNPNLERL
jgi:hypothetical protein